MGNYMESLRQWWYDFDDSLLEGLNKAERSDSPVPRRTKYRPTIEPIEEEDSAEESDTIEL